MAYTTINKSSDYFNTLLYSGDGNTGRNLTGVGFEPSWVWIKERTSTSDHMLFDQPRGVQKYISSNLNNAEQTSSQMLTAFDSDGFTIGPSNDLNDPGQTYVSWNWKANGAGSSNTDGSITSTVSASTTSGFSVVKWTGTASAGTIGHGLGVAPKVVLVKRYSTSGGGWLMQHGDLTGATYVIKLNTTGAEENDGANFNSAFPTSSVFSVYNSNNTNASGADHIAYCFAEKQGFSKFGSYTGNANANGAFIYTGFKPAFVLIKQSSASGENWNIYDNKRNTFNATDKALFADLNNAEATKTGGMDFLSNGIKMRGTDGAFNTSQTYIYMCFAEAPLVGSNNVPCTAR